MRRGDLFRVRTASSDPKHSRVFVIVSRQSLIGRSLSSVICAPIHSGRRGIRTEVHVGLDEGLKHDSSVLCDLLTSVPKSLLTDYIGALAPAKLEELHFALRIALEVE